MKFYVQSNNFKIVVAGSHISNPRRAACEAFLQHYNCQVTISPLTIVSERGFDYTEHDHNEDHVFNTCDILIDAGFKIEE